MLTLIRYFSLFVGDYNPENDPVWLFFLTFREIVDIVTAPYVDRQATEYLRTLISEHHEMFISLFNCKLKPKHHYMLHYPDLMLKLGPLVNFWSMRWESKHRPCKQGAHVVNSRKNLPLTLAMRHQLQQCFRFYSNEPFISVPVCGPHQCSFSELRSHLGYSEFSRHVPTELKQENVMTVRWRVIKGTKYESNMVVHLGYKKELPFFGLINYIVPSSTGDIFFIVSLLKTIGFNQHFYSYEVENSQKWKCVKQKDFCLYQPLKLTCTPRNALTFVIPRFKL